MNKYKGKLRVTLRLIHFSTFAKFSKTLISLTPDTHTYVSLSGGKKYYFLAKFCEGTK